jgi:hypothetical protein
MLWLRECPFDDQGLIRPLVTGNGDHVLICDACSTVWCQPEDIDAGKFVVPEPPDWAACGGNLTPGANHWANRDELIPFGWDKLDWHDDQIDPAQP